MMQNLSTFISKIPAVPSAFGDNRVIFYRLCSRCSSTSQGMRDAQVFFNLFITKLLSC